MSNMKMIRYIKEKRRRDALGGMLGKKLSVAVCRVVIAAMVIELNETGLNGIKEAVMLIKGKGAFPPAPRSPPRWRR